MLSFDPFSKNGLWHKTVQLKNWHTEIYSINHFSLKQAKIVLLEQCNKLKVQYVVEN